MAEHANSDTSVERNFAAANAIEALINYQDTDEALLQPLEPEIHSSNNRFFCGFTDDQSFWDRVFSVLKDDTQLLHSPNSVELLRVVISEWTPRIPGLFWRPHAKMLRNAARENIESRTGRWITYNPQGKSEKVAGGVGTVRLPPSESGYRLACATASLNASTGVPILIAPEVWERHRLAEGTIIDGVVTLRQLPGEWSRNFPSIKGIPKICLALSDPDAISVHDTGAPVLFHPFTIMEYWDTDAQLLDFVYCTGDSTDSDYRQSLEAFFEDYRQDKGRDGRYLTNADVSDPMWNAEYSSPADMRDRPARVNLIEARALEAASGQSDLEALIRLLSRADEASDLKRVSDAASIAWRRWFRENDPLARQVEQLAGFAVDDGDKLLRLTQAARMEFAQ